MRNEFTDHGIGGGGEGDMARHLKTCFKFEFRFF